MNLAYLASRKISVLVGLPYSRAEGAHHPTSTSMTSITASSRSSRSSRRRVRRGASDPRTKHLEIPLRGPSSLLGPARHQRTLLSAWSTPGCANKPVLYRVWIGATSSLSHLLFANSSLLIHYHTSVQTFAPIKGGRKNPRRSEKVATTSECCGDVLCNSPGASSSPAR